MFTVIDTHHRTLVANGYSVVATIETAIAPDDTDPAGDFDFGDENENAEYLARFHSGELEMVLIRVRATWNGLEGSDYLGANHLLARDVELGALEAAQDHGMADNAIAELVQSIVAAQLRA
jgi:hypothetical protein